MIYILLDKSIYMDRKSSFMNAMNAGPKLTKGEKGSDSFTETGVEDVRVAFVAKLVRDLSANKRQQYVRDIVKKGQELLENGNEAGYQWLTDLFVILFQTRDIRGGKGERDLFYGMVLDLYPKFPKEMERLLPLIPQVYGSWLDLNKLWILIEENPHFKKLRRLIISLYSKQLILDSREKENSKLSLAGKWAPREKNKYWKMALSLIGELYGTSNLHKKKYRKLISDLNRRLKTVEIDMCSNTWRSIKPGAVPAANLMMHRKAFLNEKLKTGGERSDKEDRRICASNFREYLSDGKKKVHGQALHVHQIVRAYLPNPKLRNSNLYPPQEFDPVLEAQFEDQKRKFQELGTLSATCVLLDVSGSMHSRGTSIQPILPAMALTALITQINHPAFRNAYINFSTQARWKNYGAGKSLKEILEFMLSDGDWQGSTNFSAAMNLILKTCIEHKVPNEEIPDLLVLSDMQFDEANSENNQHYRKKGEGFEAHYQIIQRSFKEAGYKRAPIIRFWNLASDTLDFPAQANSAGVEIYSGFSANLLQHFMEGSLDKYREPTPYENMRRILDDSRYDKVREILSNMEEGVFGKGANDLIH